MQGVENRTAKGVFPQNMAALEELWQKDLPHPWTYGVTGDGRVFFLNEDSRSTTWLHPVYNHPIQSGHTSVPDLPKGWEVSFTPEGIPYYVDHTNLRTTFTHPVTGETAAVNVIVRDAQTDTGSSSLKRSSFKRRSTKQKVVDKAPSAKRSVDSQVTLNEWLYKQEGGALKTWKKRWFVLSDFCLYFYKESSTDQKPLESVVLPSYRVSPCDKDDGITRKYAFKAEHHNMRTFFFAADTEEDMANWINALTLAAHVETDPKLIKEYNNNNPTYSSEGQAEPEDTGGFLPNPKSTYDDPHRSDRPTNQDPESRTGTMSRQTHPDYYPMDKLYDPQNGRSLDRNSLSRNTQDLRYSSAQDPRNGNPRQSAGQDPRYRNSLEPRHGSVQDPRDRLSQSSSRQSFNQDPRQGRGDPRADPRGNPWYASGDAGRENADPRHSQQQLYRDNGQRLETPRGGPWGEKLQPTNSYDRTHEPPERMSSYSIEPISLASSELQRARDEWQQPRQSRIIQPPGGSTANSQEDPPDNFKAIDPRVSATAFTKEELSFESSTQRTLDRSFDSSQPLPMDRSYDSTLGPRQQQQALPARNDYYPYKSMQVSKDDPAPSQNSSRDVGRNDSLRRLQQWQHNQVVKHPRGQHPNGNDRDAPQSDGLRRYGGQSPRATSDRGSHYSENSLRPGSDRGSTRASPRNGDVSPQRPLTVDTYNQDYQRPNQAQRDLLLTTAQRRTNQKQPPSSPEPARPPLPAAYRQQYINDLADTKTPHTRVDLLQAATMENQRLNEPLVFKYPESPPEKQQQQQPSFGFQDQPPQERTWQQPSDKRYNQPQQQQPQQHQQQHQQQQQSSRDGAPSMPAKRPLDDKISQALAQGNKYSVRDPNKSWEDFTDIDPMITAEGQRSSFPDDMAQIRKSEPQYVNINPYQQREERVGQAQNQFEAAQTGLDRSGSSARTPRRSLERDFLEKERALEPQGGFFDDPDRDASFQGHNGWSKAEDGSRDSYSSSLAEEQQGKWVQADDPKVARFEFVSPQKHYQQQPGEQHPHLTGPPQQQQQQQQQHDDDDELQYSGHLSPTSRRKLSNMRRENRISQSLGDLDSPDETKPDKNHTGEFRTEEQKSLPDHMDSDKDYVPYLPGSYPQPGASPRLPRQQEINLQKRDIETIKEDPTMGDGDILTTKTLEELQRHLNGNRLRLSISAADLIGKSHEELVLLLIQLRRAQSRLENARDYYRARMDHHKPEEKEYKLKRKNSIGRLEDAMEKEHEQYVELRKWYDELEKQLEVIKPMVNLLDNMVKMGSLYGGDNLMFASQYKQHKLNPGEFMPPKKMIEFSRRHQEDKLTKEQEDELNQLMEDEVDLDEKLQQLYKLDRELQEKSLTVTSLQEDKVLLERALEGVRKQEPVEKDPRRMHYLKQQRQDIEAELLKVRQQLAECSRQLEVTAAENAKVENEVILLRKKVYGLNRSHSTPMLVTDNTRAKLKLEQELDSIKSVMDGLSLQGAQISETMKALRHSNPDLTAASGKNETSRSYYETDLDSMHMRDLSQQQVHGSGYSPKDATGGTASKSPSAHGTLTRDAPPFGSDSRDRTRGGEPDRRDYQRTTKEVATTVTHQQYTIAKPVVANGYQPRDQFRSQQELSSQQREYADPRQIQSVERIGPYTAGRDQSSDIYAVPRSYLRDYPPSTSLQRAPANQIPITSPSSSRSSDRKSGSYSPRREQRNSHQNHRSSPYTRREEPMARDDPSSKENGKSDKPGGATSVPVEEPLIVATVSHELGPRSGHTSNLPADSFLELEEELEMEAEILCKEVTHELGRRDGSTMDRGPAPPKHPHTAEFYRQHHAPTSKPMNEVPPQRPDDLGRQGGENDAGDDTVNSLSRWRKYSDHRPTKDWQGELYDRKVQNAGGDDLGQNSHAAPQRHQPYEQREQPAYAQKTVTSQSNNQHENFNDISDADDNTKRFYGLLPREKKGTTVRDVKKRETERRGRDRDRRSYDEGDVYEHGFRRSQSLPRKVSAPVFNQKPKSYDDSALRNSSGSLPIKRKVTLKAEDRRKSASERLFPVTSTSSTEGLKTQEHAHRMSDIFTPRPFSVSRSSSLASERSQAQGGAKITPASVATVRPVISSSSSRDPKKPSNQQHLATFHGKPASAVKPLSPATDISHRSQPPELESKYWQNRAKLRNIPRSRFMTISSSQPAKMEQTPSKKTHVRSAAGDLISARWHDDIPDLIKYEAVKDRNYDEKTIEREVLYVPNKVEINERYVPDSDEEKVTEAERILRQKKGDQIRKMLAAQSLQDWSQDMDEMESYHGPQNYQLQAEKQRREDLLGLQQALAKEVTQKSKEVAVKTSFDMPNLSLMGDRPPTPTTPRSSLHLGIYDFGKDVLYIPSLPPEETLSYPSCGGVILKEETAH